MQDYEKLKVWQRADSLVLRVYEVTKTFPQNEWYGLQGQIRRAAVSVPANIVEGARLGTGKEFARHLAIALGSASEVEYLIFLARRLGFIETETAMKLRSEWIEVCRMLNALYRRVLQASRAAREESVASLNH